MTVEGIDYSEGAPGGAAIVAAGKRFVVRYIPYAGYPKGLTAPELADLRANSLAVALVYESDDHRPLGGIVVPAIDDAYAASLGIARPHVTPSWAGSADAWWSNKQAAGLGFPAKQPIYFGVDFDANVGQRAITATDPDHRPELTDYLRGAAGPIGLARVGVYASYWVVEWAFANGLVSFGWQTYAWSGGRVSTRAQLYQYRNSQYLNGKSVDYDRAQATNYGQWPAGLPDSSTGEDMTITKRKGEDWLPTTTNGQSNGVLRATPDAAAPIVQRVPAGVITRSIAEIRTTAATDYDWRLTAAADGTPLYMLRRDWNPLVQGGDPKTDAALADYIARADAYANGYAAAKAAAAKAVGGI